MATAAYTPPPFPCSIVVVQTTGQFGKTFKFERKDWCVLGANEDCDIIVPFQGVAQLQALVHVKRHGVFLQGIDKVLPVRHPRLQKQLTNEEEVLLHPGDVFFLGERKFLVEYSAEHATLESTNNTSSVKESNASRITSKSPRNPTPRSTRSQRRRRKSSLVVGEHDEQYVSPRNGSERLLSKSQLARISQSEQDILPEGAQSKPMNDQESTSPQAKSEHDSEDEDDLSLSPSSDESTVLSDPRDDVSRNIDFSTIENDLPVLECDWKQPDTGLSDTDKSVSSRERKELVFARLSKGLSATPRRGEKTTLITRKDVTVLKVSGPSLHGEARALTGKENIPQLSDHLSKTVKPTDRKPEKDSSRIRSPLSNRSELENQVTAPLDQHMTPTSTRHVRGVRLGNPSMQTPRGRSVAFASNIELAPGAHYSPFRPKQIKSAFKSNRKAEEKKKPGNMPGSARMRRPKGLMPTGSPSRNTQKTKVTKHYKQGPAPTSSLEGLGAFFYSKEEAGNTSHLPRQPVVEYEDDSNPPTPSSTDEGPETMVPQVSEVPAASPMARVGGALADFLKRLSGTLESDDEDESSQKNEDAASHKRQSLSRCQEITSVEAGLSSSVPLMSSSEMKELSSSMSPEVRKKFVAQVESAAKDMHQAMYPVSEKALTQDVSEKDEDDSMDSSVMFADHDKTDEAEGEQSCLNGSSPRASGAIVLNSGEEGSALDGEKEDGSHSTLPDSCSDPGVARDAADLEIEEVFLNGAKDMYRTDLRSRLSESDQRDYEDYYGEGQTDLRSEVSEGDEIDYGDEYGEDEMSIASSGREVAAIVVENDEDLVQDFCVNDAIRSHVDDNEGQESERENSGELEDADIVEIEKAQSLPTHAVPDAKNDTAYLAVSLGEETRCETRSIKCDGAFTSHDVSQSVEDVVAPDVAAKHRISTSAGEVDETGEDKSMNDQDATANGSSELEKSAQIARIRKELSRLKKDELKARLVARELDTSGLKKDLVERLALHMTEEATPTETGESQENSITLSPQRIEKANCADTTTPLSPCVQVTPTKITTHASSAEVDSIAQETPAMVRRSARKAGAKTPSKMSVVELSPAATSNFDAESQMEVSPEPGVDLSLYRRRTVKELRQFLKDRGLDIQQKMRKEELIQHLVALSIGSDGQNLPVVTERDESTGKEPNEVPSDEPEEQSSIGTTKPQRMTVAQLRAQLKERGQCQAGIKKTLLERLSSKPERRTRSRRAVDATSCLSCQTGKVCEADTTR